MPSLRSRSLIFPRVPPLTMIEKRFQAFLKFLVECEEPRLEPSALKAE